jgi:hypothetical protein
MPVELVILICKQCFSDLFCMINQYFIRQSWRYLISQCVLLEERKDIVAFMMKYEVSGGLMRSPPAWNRSWLSCIQEQVIWFCTETTAQDKIVTVW